MSRPWIFSVSPNHVDVTDNARVGLVYKREVLQALWHALHDKVQLSLGDIAEIGPRLARINDIIAVSACWPTSDLRCTSNAAPATHGAALLYIAHCSNTVWTHGCHMWSHTVVISCKHNLVIYLGSSHSMCCTWSLPASSNCFCDIVYV